MGNRKLKWLFGKTAPSYAWKPRQILTLQIIRRLMATVATFGIVGGTVVKFVVTTAGFMTLGS